jgi:putative glutamine amidotransferase
VKDVAPGFVVTARTDDGVIEAMEDPAHPWLVGVEWHPERHAADAPQDDPDRRLFAAFRNAVLAHTNGA